MQTLAISRVKLPMILSSINSYFLALEGLFFAVAFFLGVASTTGLGVLWGRVFP